METPGYIYIASNACMPRTLKIGKTGKPPKDRVKELSAPTGVPCDFELAFDVMVRDADQAERRVHARLATHRVRKEREFFRMELKDAIAALLVVQSELPILPLGKARNEALIEGEAVAGPTSNSYVYASLIPDYTWVCARESSAWPALKDECRFGTSELHQAYVAADAALKAGDAEAMVAASKRLGGKGETARKLLLEAAKQGKVEVCGDLAKLWPEHGVNWLQKLSLLWIAASAGDSVATEELASYWHLLPKESKEQMRQLAHKLNPKFECKDL